MPDILPASETPQQRDIRMNKDIAALSYVWVLSVIVYAARYDSPFIRHHSRQAVILFILSLPVLFIPIVGRLLLILIAAGEIWGFISAANGKYMELPIIGKLARGNASMSDVAQDTRSLGQQIMAFIREIFAKKGGRTHNNSDDTKPPFSSTPL